ncbi:PE-PPE domain-containing protein [Mycolicibacterium fallax]|uniref:PE-PPE domain-containing protein n=1 Tax=Mycolicibacterium fallax TaxID=1793 RepID=A0A1X1RKF4_MYCFA|nr:PE-PPE domain-containing protein [Mycolicibacterium fallax]ORV08105.1 hypothetical protein AWC04_02320 [Mycolicibacterium fallax]BBY99532.1 ATPase AAA [Mycolicibacterium fallax]
MSKNRRLRAKSLTTAAAALLTATALTTGVVAPSANAAAAAPAVLAQRNAEVQLAALTDTLGDLIQRWRTAADNNQSVTEPGAGFEAMPLAELPLFGQAPDPGDIPDLTLGLGGRLGNAVQRVGIAAADVIPGTVNLGPVWEAFGLDPNTAISDVLGAILTSAVTDMPLPEGLPALILPFLRAGNVETVGQLLDLISFTLTDPLNIAGRSPGLNVVTTAPLFALGKALGIDAGWSPIFPDAIADAANASTALGINPVKVVNDLNGLIPSRPIIPNQALKASLTVAAATLRAAGFTNLDLRVPVVVGMGLGAFAAGEAYPQIRDAALAHTGPNATVLASVLLANPGRANGGLFARFYPLASLAGINTITRDQEGSGLNLDGSTFIPIKIDATVAYNPLSDVPAWPNPFALANTAAAAVLPTYLRGIDTDLQKVIEDETGIDIEHPDLDDIPSNVYVTLPVSTLPLLEPLALPTVATNLLLSSTGVQFNNPLVTALDPAAKMLVNLGYTDVDQGDGYNRTFDRSDEVTPFGTLPDVDWRKVPGDLVDGLGTGIRNAVDQGLIKRDDDATPALARGSQTPKLAGGKLVSQLRAAGDDAKDRLQRLTGKTTAAKDTASATGSDTARKTPIRDAAAKASAQLKKAGEDLRATVKQVRNEIKTKVRAGADQD